jgi:hypothetical protein
LDKAEVVEEVFGRLRGWRQREQQGSSESGLVVVVVVVVVKNELIDFCILPFGFLLHV